MNGRVLHSLDDLNDDGATDRVITSRFEFYSNAGGSNAETPDAAHR